MRSGRRAHPPVDNVVSEGGEGAVMEYVDDYFLSSGDKHPSLMELPFAIHEIQWERTQAEKVYIQGKSNGRHEVSYEIDLWKLELPVEGKPKFLVHQVSGPWLELSKPRHFYVETVKVVLVAAYFLAFAKQSPNASKGAVWRYVRKECSSFKAKANEKDLAQAFLLLQSIVRSDAKLETSPIIQKFFPTLFKKLGSQVSKATDKPRPPVVKRETGSPVREPAITEGTPTGKRKTASIDDSVTISDHLVKGESSTQSVRRMRSLDSFAIEADLPLSKRLTPVTMKKKPGRPGRRKKGKQSAQAGKKAEGDEEWVDEPDVCSFCDDGVEGGERLLCCDGRCMRSFHPTLDSGWANQCPSLRLTRAAVSVESYMCPNCVFEQHQCFACGKLGSSSNSTDLQEVFVCGAKQCRRFYHPDCVVKLLVPQAAQENLACRIQLGLESFACPLHKCASCNLEQDKSDSELCLVKCRRCPVAWHKKCLPMECRKQLWPVEGGKFVMYCGKHKLDPKLMTPKRDHVIFPLASKTGSSNGTGYSRYGAGLWPSCNVPVPENFGQGPHDTSAYGRVCEIITESREAVTLEKVKQKVKPAPQQQSRDTLGSGPLLLGTL